MRADGLYSVWGAVFVGKCALVRCRIREEGLSWKGVQGGKPEGEERMRGSALSSPMGVPLGYFHEYKKKRGVFELRSHVSPFPMVFSFPLPIPHYPACKENKVCYAIISLKWDSKGIVSLWRGLGQRPISFPSETDNFINLRTIRRCALR